MLRAPRVVRRSGRQGRVRAAALALGLMLAAAGPVLLAEAFPQRAAAPGASVCGTAPAPLLGPLGAVAFVRGDELLVVDLTTGVERTLASGEAVTTGSASVRWSADGRWIAFGAGYVVAAAGGAPCRPLGRTITSGRWSPTSNDLVGVTHSGGLVIGGPELPTRTLLPSGWGVLGDPAFDPSGTLVAVSRTRRRSPSRASLWTIDVSDGRARPLLRTREALPIVEGWSPDSRWVLWWWDGFFSSSLAADGLALRATSVGGEPTLTLSNRVLVHPDFLTWCGDRLVIAVGGFRDVRTGKKLFTVSLPGGTASALSRDSSRSWIWPACSPDGRWVAATAGVAPIPGGPFGKERRTLWLLPTTGSEARRLLVPSSGFANDFARWSSDGRSLLFVRRSLGARPTASLFLARIDPVTGELLSVDGPVADLGPTAEGYTAGYGYYLWFQRTDWFQPGS